MRTKKTIWSVMSFLLTFVLLLACLYTLSAVLSGSGKGYAGQSGTALAERNAEVRDLVVPLTAYNFRSTTFDASAWTSVNLGSGQLSVTRGEGLSMPSALREARIGYATRNPLKGNVSDGFSVMYIGSVSEMINDFESMFGFSRTADPVADEFNFWYVTSNGSGVRLNVNDTLNGTAEGVRYYDITGKSTVAVQNAMYVITVSRSAITIYLDGAAVQTYAWNASGNKKEYSYDTLSFINEAEYFNVGIADSLWGNAAIDAQYISLYDTALTGEQVAALSAARADLSPLSQPIAAASGIDPVMYETEAYASFWTAYSGACDLNWDAEAGTVSSLAGALTSATAALEAHERSADLTDALVAAYPLSSDGKNIVNATAEEVKFMDGDTLGTLTAASSFARRQKVSGAKLFSDSNLADREMRDVSPTPTTGLKIPSDAFAGVTAQTGMTITVSIYSYNFYNNLARIFQFGTKADGDGADGAQLYLMVSGWMQCGEGNTVYAEGTYGIYIAGEWITVSISFAPDGSMRMYMSSNTSDRIAGGMTSVTFTNKAAFDRLVDAIVNGDDNWIGRSYWSADGNAVALASNLSVYNRALMPEEVEQLHHTNDLSVLVGA